MTAFIQEGAPVIVQGMTGHQGMTHTARMLRAGTNIVGGVNPRKAGSQVTFEAAREGRDVSVPVYATCAEAKEATGAQASVVFVPPRFAKGAVVEAVEAGIGLIVVITEGIPVADSAYFVELALQRGVRIIGPNCPGLISPEKSLAGILPGNVFKKGNVGVISRSGTLTYEIVYHLTANGMGQSTAIGMGGDPVVGLYFRELLEMFQNDKDTESIVMIGEIGGNAEELAAEYIKKHVTKPVVAFIAGQSAPPGMQMGHAGAIISGNSGSAEEKIAALTAAGIQVANEPAEVPILLKASLPNK